MVFCEIIQCISNNGQVSYKKIVESHLNIWAILAINRRDKI